jgi:hypothetical protein
MTTDTLIERLARELQPVRALPRPAVRTAMWISGAAIYLALIAVPLTSRADVAANTAGGIRFFIPQLLAIVTGIVAAVAAFASVIPGYSRRLWIAAATAAATWAASLAIAARGQWSQPLDPALPSEWVCVALIVGSGAPLMFAIARMLRRGALFNPALTAALGALAVTSLASVGACITHPHTNNAVTLVWHGITLLVLVIVSAMMSRRILIRRNGRHDLV